MKLLLSSNSTLHKEPYLQFCKEDINLFLAENNAKKVVFIPFAAVTFSYDQYLENVQNGLYNNEIEITSIHQYEDKINAIKTFYKVVHDIHIKYKKHFIQLVTIYTSKTKTIWYSWS